VHQDATGAYLVIGVLFDNANDATHESMQEILQDFPVRGKERARESESERKRSSKTSRSQREREGERV